jgi:hypothetical protein
MDEPVHCNFVKICLTTNASDRRESRWLGSLKSCLWLCECLGIQCFGVGGNISFRVCEGK